LSTKHIAPRFLTMRLILALLATLLLALPVAAQSPRKPDLASVDARMQSLVAQYRLDGASLWLSHNGVPVMTAHYGGYGPTTREPIASASKWVSALVLARLVERGVLRWDSTVGEWWPELTPEKRGITLAQLFSHTSGIAGEESGCIGNPQTTLQACAAQILAAPLVRTPGTTFSYGGLSMQVAGAMAERATGQTWDALFIAEVAQPLGLTATDFGFTSTAPGYLSVPNPRIAGGVRSTLADYARLMAMWQADGRVPEAGGRADARRGAVYLDPSTLREMQRDRAEGLRRASVPPTLDLYPGWGYGFGFWILPTGRAGDPVIESSPGAFGFQGWVDGAAGVAGVFLVRDLNSRMSPEAQRIQQDAARALEPQRSNGGLAATPANAEGDGLAAPRGTASTPPDGLLQVPRRVRHPDGAADGLPDERRTHRDQHRPG
jgi:CubicO group peptidase (beta-lactamase class C family)